jgi:hypothetical protein
MSTLVQRSDDFANAAQLLVGVAGPDLVHIEMSARGPKKYYDVHRPFDERDARAHLAGYRTKGATLRYPGGNTRALCYDADTSEAWQCLQEAAGILATYGYLPLLEASPVGRGGHCWIIFTELVSAKAAQRHLLILAPPLKQIYEYWPRWTQKVRLPAGKYVKPGFAAWCKLTDAQGTLLAPGGTGAALALLASQTPIELLPRTTMEYEGVGPGGEHKDTPDEHKAQVQERKHVVMGQVDTRWKQQYNSGALWFQFTPRQLAALYNERHPLPELLRLEQNGMAFSPSVQERTPSTAITRDGQAWVDFSAQSRQSDGKHDGGDALELAARRNGETKATKRVTFREAARMLVHEARETLEGAARAGEEPPSWVAQIMTEAGWQRYRSLRAEAAKATAGTASRGVTGYLPVELTSHRAQESLALLAEQSITGTHIVSHERRPEKDSLRMLAAEIQAQIGEPCSRCGCTLFYQSGSYRMCLGVSRAL